MINGFKQSASFDAILVVFLTEDPFAEYLIVFVSCRAYSFSYGAHDSTEIRGQMIVWDSI